MPPTAEAPAPRVSRWGEDRRGAAAHRVTDEAAPDGGGLLS
ncbi:MAG: hypothetical protein U0470_12290 [Anaerolineae bacterium]